MTPILQAFATGALAVFAATGAVGVMNKGEPDLAAPEGPWETGSALDGRIFYTVDTIVESGETMNDELHFVDGRFESSMCREYCDCGRSKHETRWSGANLHFAVTTRRPETPHTVVWYGEETGDDIRFEGIWATRRWYWPRHIEVVGEGSTTPPSQENSDT